MANKVLLGVGIGCGALVVVGLVAIGGVAFWAKRKMDGAVEGLKDAVEQEQQVVSLNEKYPFTPPPEGEPLKLDEKRLEDYLAVRAAVVPVFKSFEGKAKDMEKRYEGKGDSIGKGLEAMGALTQLYRSVREAWLAELDRRRMSPREYHAITGTVYASYIGKGMAEMQRGHRDELAKAIAELEERRDDEGMTPEAKKVVDEQLEAMKAQLESLPEKGEVDEKVKVWDANAALLEKHRKRIEEQANSGVDVLLFTEGSAEGFEDAFAPLQKGRKDR